MLDPMSKSKIWLYLHTQYIPETTRVMNITY
jgi:hypothetical protein